MKTGILAVGSAVVLSLLCIVVQDSQNSAWHRKVQRHIEETDFAVAEGVYRTGFRAGMVNAAKMTHLKFTDGARLPSGAVVSNCLILQVMYSPPLFAAVGVTNVTLANNQFYRVEDVNQGWVRFDDSYQVSLLTNLINVAPRSNPLNGPSRE